MQNYGLDITDKKDLVGICYTMWFNCIFGDGDEPITEARNVTELLKTYSFSREKGFYKENGETKNESPCFHFWAKPAQGYYRSTDKEAHRRNLRMIADAGVDFIVLDYTYAVAQNGFAPGQKTWDIYIGGPMQALLTTMNEMRKNGEKTPYIVAWPNDSSMFEFFKKCYIDKAEYRDLFVYWDGKPLILNWNDEEKAFDDFTVRSMYGLQGKVHTNQWSFLEHKNDETVSYDKDGNPEHMTCCVASQRTYMSMPETAQGREGGRFWNRQWQNVFKIHPKITTITWWNEWAAQLYKFDGVGYIFTDNFNVEYSRDIEPMEGGHGDTYYKWLCEYVKAYKNHENCPELHE